MNIEAAATETGDMSKPVGVGRRQEESEAHSKALRGYSKKTAWPESASELCRPSDRRLSAKLVPTFADRGCHVVSVTDTLRP
jgi:hypothetical protein